MSNNLVIEYSKATKHVCLCTVISIVLIIIFMLSPLNQFIITSIFGKIIILTLLGYTLYANFIQNNQFSKKFNVVMMNTTWDPVKTNILCSYVFSLFLIILILSVIKSLF
uniref:Uncharacterized protein n=1 Tax=viral metagenome TaxID=1070528 RepID=A0A6C0F5M8_9ZZZZ